jgi:hypothetical protein
VSGKCVLYTGTWNGVELTMNLNQWKEIIGRSRGFIDHKLKSNTFQEILDSEKPRGIEQKQRFLYNK